MSRQSLPSEGGAAPRRLSPRLEAAAAALLLLSFFLRALAVARAHSLTVDEPPHLVAGYYYLRHGDYTLNPEHPPLAKVLSGIALLPLRPAEPPARALPGEDPDVRQWRLADDFLTANRSRLDQLVFRARLPLAVLGAALVAALYLLARDMYGPAAGLLTLFLAAGSPHLLAHAPLVTTDAPGLLFMVLTLFFYRRLLLGRGDPGRQLLAGAFCLALGMATRFSVPLFLLPSLLAIALQRRFRPPAARPPGLPALSPARLAAAVGLVLFTVAAFYRFSHLPRYFEGLSFLLFDSSRLVWWTFLNGEISTSGWRAYYAWVILLKTTLPVLCLAPVAAFAWRGRPDENLPFLLWPAFFFFAVASLSSVQLGLRYILPVYGLGYVFIGRLAPALASLGRREKRAAVLVVAGLVAWHGLEAARVHPSYLSYFNQLAGGPRGGWHHLLDSNIDWGQDLRHLARFLREAGNPPLILSYDGSVNPELYGISYQPLLMHSPYRIASAAGGRLNPPRPDRELLAVSVNNLQGFNHDYPFLAWLRELTPVARAGYSILIYDISSAPGVRRNLAAIYRALGQTAESEREEAMVRLLETAR